MTGKTWLEQKMDEARNDIYHHEVAVEAAKARYKAYMEMWKHLPVEQMEMQIAGENPAKE